jgi:glycine/D-amino acid oxidase-like deaminating enzyme/nitrite reductase/ring-hydroxylating ferredoxin subunit
MPADRRGGVKAAAVASRRSLWLRTAPATRYRRLRGDVRADVAILGGGIAGLTTALLLKRDGARVAVLEAARVASGVTGCTTAKVTVLQGTMLSAIRNRHGQETSAAYAEASLAAVEQVAALTAAEGIDCDLERRAACTFALDDGEISAVEGEAEAARRAGLTAVMTDQVDLPFTVPAAVRLDGQIQLHPVRYCQGLAAAVDGDGSIVFEGSRVHTVEEGDPCRVRTADGVVSADRVVVATHYPILDRGLHFARLAPQRSYCIAVRVRGPQPRDMSINAGSPTRSVRSHGDVVIVGGEGHATGASQANPERYARLEEFARRHWRVARVDSRWSAQDPMPYDHLPVIGPYTPVSSRLFVASGFMKWGMTGGTLAAMMLRDRLGGRENPWARHFTPSRLSLTSAPNLVRMNAKVGADFIGDRIAPAEAASVREVPRGAARVVRRGVGKVGVYRDPRGAVHAVSLRCTHLGCLLRFNAAERSWDCPCHGSRFDVDGAVLEGPATRRLTREST